MNGHETRSIRQGYEADVEWEERAANVLRAIREANAMANAGTISQEARLAAHEAVLPGFAKKSSRQTSGPRGKKTPGVRHYVSKSDNKGILQSFQQV